MVLPIIRASALIGLLAAGASVLAGPLGFGVNSRGNEEDSNRVDALWRIDLESGQAEYIGWTGFFDLEALAVGPDGILYGADDESKTIVRVSRTSGLAAPIGGLTGRGNMGVSVTDNFDFGMAFDCQGRAFVVSDTKQTLFEVDLDSGELTAIGQAGSLGAPITDLAVYGQTIVGIGVGLDVNGDTVAPNLYRINLSDGTSELIGPLGAAASPYNNAGLEFDDSGVLWAITDRRAVPGGDFPSEVLRIDPLTGEAEKVAETVVGIESLAIDTPAECSAGVGSPPGVPVPLMSGLGGVVLVLLIWLIGMALVSGPWRVSPRQP